MAERIPPLLWVRVFEAAARHGNFVAAAKELSVSPAAISRTIKELEAFMGAALFVRKARGVELTKVGQDYVRAVAPAIEQITRASVELRLQASYKSLRVTAMPALAQRWLVPKLGEFNDLHPDITVTVLAESAVLDLSQGQFDVALRYDSSHHENFTQVELFGEELFPVVSPKLVETRGLRTPQDLFGVTALYDTYWESDWEVWLAALNMRPPSRWRGLHFTLYTMAVDAAVAGQGVLIGHGALIKDELQSGKLVAPFGPRVNSRKRYYAVAPAAKAALPAVQAFMEWLCSIRERSVAAAP